MKRTYLHSALTKRVLASLLCTGVLSAWGGLAAEAAPTPAGYSEESIGGATWYVYESDLSDVIYGQPGDHIQLGDGTTAVTISSPKVYGGYAEGNAAVSGSAVTIKPNVTTNSDAFIYGGYTEAGTASDNSATMEGGTVEVLIGGESYNGDAENNTVTVKGGTVTGDIYGSYSENGKASDGTVTIISGEMGDARAYGSYSKEGSASGGKVVINGGKLNVAWGSYSNTYSDGGSATDGEVIVNGGEVNDVTGASSVTGSISGKVIINGGKVGVAIGAMADGPNTSDTRGEVIITGGEVEIAVGGVPNGGTVTLRGDGKVTGIFGSWSEEGNDATGGVVNLEGGDEHSLLTVVGGLVIRGEEQSATHNTVNLKASYPEAEIFGGDSHDGADNPRDLVTGNTLNVYGKDLKVHSLKNFQYLNFYLPEGTAANDTLLTVDADNDGGALYIPAIGSTVNVYAEGTVNLNVGDEVTLVSGYIDDEENGGTITGGNNEFGTLSRGVSTDYTIVYETKTENEVDDYIKIRVTGIKRTASGSTIKDQMKSLVETPAFTAALVAGGADMLVNTTIHDAWELTKTGESNKEWTVFASTAYNDMRYETGSHVDSDGWNANLGFVRRFENKSGELMVGPFFEYGKGDYDSYSEGIHADGDGHFTGGGLLIKQQNKNGFYYEGSVRGGRVSADYKTDDMVAGEGVKKHVSYDYDASYYAFHAGLGKVFELKNDCNIDAYVRYLYSHQNSFDATLSTGEHYDFDSVTSSKIRTGFRWTKAVNEHSRFYAGLAYQYEFDNEATAHFDGDSTLSPSLQGSSGMAELGWRVTPGKRGNMAIDTTVTGWAGKQRGVNFRVGAQWSF